MQNREHVSCVLVTYNPDQEKLLRVLDSLYKQANQVFIVDNTNCASNIDFSKYKNLRYIPLNKNTGIATAQNIGIREAQKIGSKYIWLSDQDTVYPKNYLENILPYFKHPLAPGLTVGAVVPAYFDTTKDSIQPFTVQAPFTRYFLPREGVNLVSHSIASGMVIPIKVLEKVGLMQDDLFIDTVDLEWCWRAKKNHGYQTIGIGDIVIRHTMGDRFVKFFGRKVGFRNPFRHYYMIRNAIHLSLYSQSPGFAVKLELFVKALAWTVIFPMIAPDQKTKHLQATLRGMFDGICNKLGPMKN